LLLIAVSSQSEEWNMPRRNGVEHQARSFKIALGTAMGKPAWRWILERSAEEIRLTFSERQDAQSLRQRLKELCDGHQLEGYLLGVEDGYGAARRLLTDEGHADSIAKIFRRHPNWTTKQICRRLDALGKVIPPWLLRKGAKSRLWEDAVKDRNSLLTKRVEKHISRIRIAARLMSKARGWKSYLDTGILP
jgi:hypothetical protein